jgi:hypothetical protein
MAAPVNSKSVMGPEMPVLVEFTVAASPEPEEKEAR